MTAGTAQTSVEDPIDRAIVRALQISPRVTFSELADVLDLSEQTVARRYRRLRRDGLVRLTAIISAEALGESNWIVRLECRPTGATSLAQALAQRDDVGWVSISAGGTQVLCAVRSRTAQAREELLLQRLPRTTQVLGISAAMVLHTFVGSSSDDWSIIGEATLTPEQEQRLRSTAEWSTSASSDQAPTGFDTTDLAMLRLLTADGRASITTLARAAGISEGRAARRLRALFECGVAYLDLDAPAHAYGFNASANLWLTVAPAEIERAGRAIANCPEVPFAAAITGTHNIYLAALCRDVPSLYRFVTERVGAIPGVTSLEVTPTLRVVKQAGTLISDGRLAP